MGCGSAKISLTHRRGGGKKRNGNNSDDSDTETEEGATGGSSGGRCRQHQLRGSHKVRPASLVTSTSVDSQLLKTTNKRPKITTSFSQNDFSTTTSVSGTSRIRVTLSHDGSLLEVETETFETLEEGDDDTDDPDAIRTFRNDENTDDWSQKHHGNQKSNSIDPVTLTRQQGHRTRQETVFPSCSGTQPPVSSSSRAVNARHLCGSGDTSSDSSSRFGGIGEGGGSLTSVRHLGTASHGCDTEDEEEYDNSTEVTAFIAVADIEVEPPQTKTRATRSKSINSILSQAEENHLQELEQKPRRTCKECGCVRYSHKKDGSYVKGSGTQDLNPSKDKKCSGQGSLIKRAAKSLERTPSATESSDGDLQKDVSRKSSRSGGSTPYKTASQKKHKSDKKKQVPDGASPLAIEKHTECCCYCHQKKRSKGRSRKSPDRGDTDSSSSMLTGLHDPWTKNHSAPPGSKPDSSHRNNPHSDTDKCNLTRVLQPGKKQTVSLCHTPVEQVQLTQNILSDQPQKAAWSNHVSSNTLSPDSTNSDHGVDKDKIKQTIGETKRNLFTSNDSIVTVPVAPIVDPNTVFNFDDQEWAELTLVNGNPSGKSPNQSAELPSTTKPKLNKEFSKKQTKTNSKESRSKKASKLLMSSRSSSFAGHSSASSRSSGKSSTDLPRIPSGLRSVGSSGCVTDMDDGDVTDHSVTTMTSSSSIGDVTSLAMVGLCDTLDPTAVCVQVHSDFFNDFCDFYDDEDVGLD